MTTTRTNRSRVTIAVLIIIAVVSVFVVRLVDIQVVSADTLNAESFSARSRLVDTVGTRGNIVDTNGTVLAGTVTRYTITASPKQAFAENPTLPADAQKKVTALAAALGVDAASITTLLTADPSSQYAVIAKSIDVPKYNAVLALGIEWLYYKAEQSRTYPNGSVAGNIVGFVGADGEAQAGMELKENSCLAGTNGAATSETGEDGVTIPGSTVTQKKAVDGGDVELTLDSNLQWFSQEALGQRVQETGAESGTAIVMDRSGKVLAAAEYPTVDPNNVDATPAAFRGSQIFQAPFEPGSIFKTFTAAALVDAGDATPNTQVLAPYEYDAPNGAVIHDSEVHDPAPWTLTGVLQQSSNTGISMLSNAMPVDQRYDYMKKFHLGEPSEVGFPGESGGILHPVDEWDNQTTYNTTFGQGISTTAIQMASIYQTIANGGVRMPVQLVKGCRQADGTMKDVPEPKGEQVISASAAKDVSNMLESVVTSGYASSELQIPGYRISAKTGTAEMSDGEGQYGSLYLTSLSGVAPSDNPQYVVSVTISKPVTMTSGLAAAPVFQKILSQVLKTYRVQPSSEPAPDLPLTY